MASREKNQVFFWIALVSILGSIAAHVYLSFLHYDLHLGLSGTSSFCNLTAVLNCDAVTASSFSTFLGVPMAIWGLTANGILFLFLAGFKLGWADNVPRLGRASLYLGVVIAAASLVMAVISTLFLKTYCLFCIFAYLLSFSALVGIWLLQDPPAKSSLGSLFLQDLKSLFGEGKAYFFWIVALGACGFLLNTAIMGNLNAKDLGKVAERKVEEWKVNLPVQFAAEPLLKMGSPESEAKMHIVEFADFLCGHCKRAAPVLDAFVNSRPGVSFKFYSFPLDKLCNPEVEGSNGGLTCFLAKVVYCSNKSGHGHAAKKAIFEAQESLHGHSEVTALSAAVQSLLAPEGIAWEEVQKCTELPETQQFILANAAAGKAAGIRGTPAIFVNGKLLEGGQFITVLEKAYEAILNQN